MQARRGESGVWVVALERGEDLRSSLESLAADEGLTGAKVSAIGALEQPEIGWYDLGERAYQRERLSGLWELISLLGNLALVDGVPFLHAHVALTGRGFDVKGGHLVDARVGLAVEAFVEPVGLTIRRTSDAFTGLATWDPGQKRPDPGAPGG